MWQATVPAQEAGIFDEYNYSGQHSLLVAKLLIN